MHEENEAYVLPKEEHNKLYTTKEWSERQLVICEKTITPAGVNVKRMIECHHALYKFRQRHQALYKLGSAIKRYTN